MKKGPALKALIQVARQEIVSIELVSNKERGRFEWEIVSGEPTLKLSEKIDLWMEQYCSKKQPEIVLPIQLDHLPPYTKFVLNALRQIPFGNTVSYKQLAEKTGNPKGARAVGNACGRNPFLLVVPCHRVLATNGLGGFASGLDIKRELLAFEEWT